MEVQVKITRDNGTESRFATNEGYTPDPLGSAIRFLENNQKALKKRKPHESS